MGVWLFQLLLRNVSIRLEYMKYYWYHVGGHYDVFIIDIV